MAGLSACETRSCVLQLFSFLISQLLEVRGDRVDFHRGQAERLDVGLLLFWLFGRVEGGMWGVGEGDGVEVVSDAYGLLKASWFAKFYFNTNFFFEAPDVSIDHFFFADGGD